MSHHRLPPINLARCVRLNMPPYLCRMGAHNQPRVATAQAPPSTAQQAGPKTSQGPAARHPIHGSAARSRSPSLPVALGKPAIRIASRAITNVARQCVAVA